MNIVEYARKTSIGTLFSMPTFGATFPKWKPRIEERLGQSPDFFDILNLGDSLADIFKSTGAAGRNQASLSGGGNLWEGLVCWYLNLCLVGSRSVVVKRLKKLLPPCIEDAITVNYGNVASNSESDLITTTFPNNQDFTKDMDIDTSGNFDYINSIDSLCKNILNQLEVGIIQCKTNWNDNAQIPMLWEIVYSSKGFDNSQIKIGRNGVSMKDFKKFFYAFVTVPSQKGKFKSDGLPVQRVRNLSGGNYWGRPSQSGIASSVKEIFNKNFSGWLLDSQKDDVESAIKNKQSLGYFSVSL